MALLNVKILLFKLTFFPQNIFKMKIFILEQFAAFLAISPSLLPYRTLLFSILQHYERENVVSEKTLLP